MITYFNDERTAYLKNIVFYGDNLKKFYSDLTICTVEGDEAKKDYFMKLKSIEVGKIRNARKKDLGKNDSFIATMGDDFPDEPDRKAIYIPSRFVKVETVKEFVNYKNGDETNYYMVYKMTGSFKVIRTFREVLPGTDYKLKHDHENEKWIGRSWDSLNRFERKKAMEKGYTEETYPATTIHLYDYEDTVNEILVLGEARREYTDLYNKDKEVAEAMTKVLGERRWISVDDVRRLRKAGLKVEK